MSARRDLSIQIYLHDPAVDGVVEVLGLEHRHLQDAMEVDDLSSGAASFFLRAHAWRARSARCAGFPFPRVAELL